MESVTNLEKQNNGGFEVSHGVAPPTKPNCLGQLALAKSPDIEPLLKIQRENVLQTRQGIAEVMKLHMELKATDSIGRLPFLQSSNLMKSILLDSDNYMDFEDIFGGYNYHEFQNQPAAVMERF